MTPQKRAERTAQAQQLPPHVEDPGRTYVRELVDLAPPLTAVRLDRLARLLAPDKSGQRRCADAA